MRTVVVICIITASAIIGPSAWAGFHTPEDHDLDQYQESYNYGYSVGDTTLMAQTFTAGEDGVLCHIQIGNTSGIPWGSYRDAQGQWIVAPSPPVVEIRRTVEYGPGLFRPGSDADILGSARPGYLVPYRDGTEGPWIAPELSGSPGPVGWTPLIDFDISVDAGVTYAIVLYAADYDGAVSVSGTADAAYAGSPGYDYAGGDLWTYDAGTWLNDEHLYDIQFREYVVPVPLPAGVWLGIFAVSVAGWHLKRQRA